MNFQFQQLRANQSKSPFQDCGTIPKGTCHYYKKLGHLKTDCLKLRRWTQGKVRSAFPVSVSSTPVKGSFHQSQQQSCSEDLCRQLYPPHNNQISFPQIIVVEERENPLPLLGLYLPISHPVSIFSPLPQNTQTVQLFGVSNYPVTVFKSFLIPFQLGPIQTHYPFLLTPSAPIHSPGRHCLEAQQAHVSVSEKGGIFLNTEHRNPHLQENPKTLISVPVPSLKPLPQNLSQLCPRDTTSIRYIHSALPIRI